MLFLRGALREELVDLLVELPDLLLLLRLLLVALLAPEGDLRWLVFLLPELFCLVRFGLGLVVHVLSMALSMICLFLLLFFQWFSLDLSWFCPQFGLGCFHCCVYASALF